MVDQRGVDRVVEVLDLEQLLHLGDAGLVDGHGVLALVHLVVDVAMQPGVRRANCWYQRWPCSVAPEMISGVRASSIRIESTSSTMAKRTAALDQVLGEHGHVVAQVVEAELVVGAVGDVGVVGRPALLRLHGGQDHPDLQAEEAVDDPAIHSASRLAR